VSRDNPGLVYVSVTGFGQTGPRATQPGYDFLIQGLSGIMDLTGDPGGEPQKVGVAWIDIFTGLYGVIGIQAALAEFLRRGGRDRYLERVLPVFRERRDVLLRSLATHMPDGCEWIEPAGGLCLWLTLPEGVSTSAAYRAAVAAGVSVAPGDRFMARPTARGHLRLSFGTVPAERIPAAIEALGAAIQVAAREAQGQPEAETIPLV